MLAGASGMVGRSLVNQLMEEASVQKIYCLLRKPLHLDNPKITELIVDFNQLNENDIPKDIDSVFCCLGTTMKKAKSKEAFILVDKTYVLKLAELSKKNNVQNFHIISSLGANERAMVLYSRVKGEVETAIKQLNFPNTFIYRPGLLLGPRVEYRLGENIGKILMGMFSFLLVGGLKKYKAIKGSTVARAMIKSAQYFQGYNVIESDKIEEIALK